MNSEERGSYFGVHDLPDLIQQYHSDARVDEVDDRGRTPLFYTQTILEARFLVLVGVDPEHRDNTGVPAQYNAGPEVGHYLVHGPKASYFGAHHPMLWPLNKLADADPNERDEQGRTPIFYAQSPEEVAFLIDAGADPSLVDNTGASPLFTVPGGTGVLEELIGKHGLDPNAKDHAGNSILHLTHDVELLKDALAAGTAPMLVNKTGQNAIEYREGSSGGTAQSPDNNNRNGLTSSSGGDGDNSKNEGLILGILRGIFSAITEVLGIRSRRR